MEAALVPRSYLEAGASLAMLGVLELSQVAAQEEQVLAALVALELSQVAAQEEQVLAALVALELLAPAAQGFVATEVQLVEAESSP